MAPVPPVRARARLPASLAAAAALVVAAGAQPPETTPAELLVRWRAGAGRPVAVADAGDVFAARPLLPARPAVAGRPAALAADDLARWWVLRFAGSVTAEELAARYRTRAEVDAVQPNYLRRFADFRPDDPRLHEQWALEAIGWTGRDPGSAAGVPVAIVDSGLDLDHPDLSGQVWHNEAEATGVAGVDDDGNGYVDDVAGWDFADAPGLPGDGDYQNGDPDPDDESGHGTHVAGIVAAAVGNGEGIAGVAPGARLMVLRAGFNLGGSGYLQDDDIAAAIAYAADNGARVVNLSFGDPRFSPLLADAVRYAAHRGVVVVAAAGNEASGEVFYPARLDETIAVAAATRAGAPATFSNHGPSIDLAAPGLAILSTRPGGGYDELSGTSMAAPHVAGVAALVLARHPEYGPAQVLGALVEVAVDVGAPGWDPATGHGLLQIPPPAAGPPVAVTFLAPATGDRLPGGAVHVALALEGDGPLRYAIDWGHGDAPDAWRPVAEGAWAGPGSPAPGALWPTAGLVPGEYTLRARVVSGAGRTHTDRVVVALAPAVAAASPLQFSRALRGPRWRDLISWTTDRRAPGYLELTAAGQSVARLGVPGGATDHVVELPEDMPLGRYAVRLYTDGQVATDGSVAAAADCLVLEPGAVDRWNLREAAVLPSGYPMPQVSDFDDDGRAEVAVMVYGGDSGAYGTTTFYEGIGGQPAHTSTLLFVPWSVHDLDGDGLRELMAVDARRVRLLEAPAAGTFPSRVAWELRDAWGGEVADLDGDGRPEMFLRSASAELLRVFEGRADDAFAETGALVNDSPGPNELGERQVAADLDGDGRGDLLVGDGDGDLLVFESVADDAYRAVWRSLDGDDLVDARLLGAGADLDGDGEVEFVSGRLRLDPFDVESRRWTLSVYGPRGDDDYGVEWSGQVLAGFPTGSGIAAADLDGDGRQEWVVAIVPHVYAFRADGAGGYEAVWHADAVRTQRPAVGDLDGDGRAELLYASSGGSRLVTWPVAAAVLDAPPGWRVLPEGPDRVSLRWEPVAGAEGYRLLRDEETLAVVPAAAGPCCDYLDAGVEPGRTYRYEAAAVDGAGRDGPHSPAIAVAPRPGPVLLGAARTAAREVTATFDQAMSATAAQPHRYALEPDLARPEAVVLDRGGRRAVVVFDRDLPDGGFVEFAVTGLRAESGAPLGASRLRLTLSPLAPPTRLLRAEADGANLILLHFDRPLAAAEAGRIEVDGARVRVAALRILPEDARTLAIALAPATPLRPLGRRYEVVAAGLLDDLGRDVEARAFVTVAARTLAELVVYPNPFDPSAGTLTCAGLPAGARVRLFTLAGELLWSAREEDGDGGVQWDGRVASGRLVAAGVYLVLGDHEGRERRAKVAVLRR